MRAASKSAGGMDAPAAPVLRRPSTDRRSVAVVLGLVRPFDRHVDVLGLLGRQPGELHPELVEVEPGDLLVELLGEQVHTHVVRVRLLPERELRENLFRPFCTWVVGKLYRPP